MFSLRSLRSVAPVNRSYHRNITRIYFAFRISIYYSNYDMYSDLSLFSHRISNFIFRTRCLSDLGIHAQPRQREFRKNFLCEKAGSYQKSWWTEQQRWSRHESSRSWGLSTYFMLVSHSYKAIIFKDNFRQYSRQLFRDVWKEHYNLFGEVNFIDMGQGKKNTADYHLCRCNGVKCNDVLLPILSRADVIFRYLLGQRSPYLSQRLTDH